MREVKFRAYYKPTGEMFKVLDLKPRPESGMVTGYFDGKHDYCYYSHDGEYGDAIISEYTGLKDKNDVEIYEGDIVLEEVKLLSGEVIATRRVVEADTVNPCFVLVNVERKDDVEYDFVKCWMTTLTVLGNIYEGEAK